WLGALAARHASFADLRALAAALAQLAGATLGRLAEGGNAAGAYLAGAIPHRLAGARAAARPGLTARDMLQRPLRAYLLLGGLEGFDYQSSEDVLREVREACAGVKPAGYQGSHAVPRAADAIDGAARQPLVDVPMYQTDAVVRRAPSLQKTREGRTAAVTY